MKNRVRTIVVMQQKLNWVLTEKYVRSSQNTHIALSRLTIFSNKTGRLVIIFKTRDHIYAGNPLKTGVLTANFKMIDAVCQSFSSYASRNKQCLA
jgi:hypothetical protein